MVNEKSLIIGAAITVVYLCRARWIDEFRRFNPGKDWTEDPRWALYNKTIENIRNLKQLPQDTPEGVLDSLAMLQQAMRIPHDLWESLIKQPNN